MPARTNHFQRIIKTVCNRCAEEGIEVLESAATEESFGDEREIDIRLSATVAGLPVTIAVECRDHRRKQTVEWIDQLLGKFARTTPKVDRIIAVSRSGFTDGAEKKAAEHGILTITFSDVEIVDWPKQFKCIRAVESTMDISPVAYGVTPKTELCLDSSTLLIDSEKVGNLKDFVKAILVPSCRSEIQNQLATDASKLFPNMAALKQSYLRTEHDFSVDQMAILSASGTLHKISSIQVVLHTKLSVKDTPNHFEVSSGTQFKPLDGICITNASVSEGRDQIDVSVIQSHGKPTLQVCTTRSKDRPSP